MLPPESSYPFAPDLSICRLLNGLWQVSGGHGQIDPADAIADMLRYHDAGFTTWDLADHYGPAEEFIAAFRRARLDAVHARSRDLFALIGDCGDEYRR